jgi:hypothetical protein
MPRKQKRRSRVDETMQRNPLRHCGHRSCSELAALEAAGNLLKGLHLLRTAHYDHIKKTARK